MENRTIELYDVECDVCHTSMEYDEKDDSYTCFDCGHRVVLICAGIRTM